MASILTAERTRLASPAGPIGLADIRCSKISFGNISAERVRIAAVVGNRGDVTSVPTELSIQAAPLGAFLPWKPLVSLPLPALRPGNTVTLETQALWPQRQPLGDVNSVPPGDVMAALAADDPQRFQDRLKGIFPFSRWLRRERKDARAARTTGPILPADPLELIGRRNPHWAGNLNVFVGGRSVETHVAQSLRVYPGRTNCALLCVGSGRDAYCFQLTGVGRLWDVQLHNRRRGPLLRRSRAAADAIRPQEWTETHERLLVLLELHPPDECDRGELKILVTQRSTGTTVAVEFSLDPNAQGPGCYVV